MHRASIVSLSLTLLAGCSSSYVPHTRGKVAVVMRNGQLAYVRDGRTYPHGFLGHGLGDAVLGDPSAMAAANEYTSRATMGFVGVLLGTAAEIGGMTWVAVDASRNSNLTGSQLAAPLLLAFGGLVCTLVSTGYLASAEPYRWDAINLFNDAGAMPQQPPGAPLPGYSATASARVSLKMRAD